MRMTCASGATGTRSIYTRTSFELAKVSDVTDLFFGADYDDGLVVWINGVEVYRSPEIPDGVVTWDTDPTAHESSNDSTPDFGSLVDLSAPALPLLRAGTNVLAVGVYNHQPTAPPASDLVLVPQLSMNRKFGLRYLDNQSDPAIGMSWTSESFDDD